MRVRSPLVALVATLALLLAGLPRVARADVDDDTREEADAMFQQGVASLRANDPERAVAYFQRSQALQPRVTTACNLALAYDRWPGHGAEAANAYDQCAAMDDTGSYREHATERAATIRSELARSQTPVVETGHTPIIESPIWGEGATTWGAPPGAGNGAATGPVDTTPGPPATLLVLGLGALVLGGVALGVGIGLELDAQSRADGLQTQYGGYDLPPEAAGELDDVRAQRDLGIGFYVGAGVFGALGLGALFAYISEAVSGPTGPVMGAALGPDGGRLVLRARF